MASDLGVPVDVHNLTMHNSLTSTGLRGFLGEWRGDQQRTSRMSVEEAVAAADAVTVTIGFNDIPELPAGEPTFLLDNMRTNLDVILGRINELRAGEPTIVRVTRNSTTMAAVPGNESSKHRTRSSAMSQPSMTPCASTSTTRSTAQTARPVLSGWAIWAPIEPTLVS